MATIWVVVVVESRILTWGTLQTPTPSSLVVDMVPTAQSIIIVIIIMDQVVVVVLVDLIVKVVQTMQITWTV